MLLSGSVAVKGPTQIWVAVQLNSKVSLGGHMATGGSFRLTVTTTVSLSKRPQGSVTLTIMVKLPLEAGVKQTLLLSVSMVPGPETKVSTRPPNPSGSETE